MSILNGKLDVYNCFTIDHKQLPENIKEFESNLAVSIFEWNKSKVKAVWLTLKDEFVDFIGVAVRKFGFEIHHALPEKNGVVLSLWLLSEESPTLPDFAHTTIGVGGFVVSPENKILVVKEKSGYYKGWKLPGGMVDRGEDIADAAIREVFEETGVRAEFLGLQCFRETHDGLDGQSNLYFVVALKPLTFDITPCPTEIADAQWISRDEFSQLSFFKGVYLGLHEIALQSLSAPSNAWKKTSLPIVFKPGNNTVYCSPNVQFSQDVTNPSTVNDVKSNL